MKFDKEELISLTEEGETGKLRVVKDSLLDTTRWSSLHLLVFENKEDGALYRTTYSRGLTEMQDESPFEYDTGPIDCTPVVPVEVAAIEYMTSREAAVRLGLEEGKSIDELG